MSVFGNKSDTGFWKGLITKANEHSKKLTIIDTIIFPNLLGCFIFDIAVVMFKKISGTMITNNKFKNRSPNGLNIVAFSLKIIPMMLPTIIATRSIIVDL